MRVRITFVFKAVCRSSKIVRSPEEQPLKGFPPIGLPLRELKKSSLIGFMTLLSSPWQDECQKSEIWSKSVHLHIPICDDYSFERLFCNQWCCEVRDLCSCAYREKEFPFNSYLPKRHTEGANKMCAFCKSTCPSNNPALCRRTFEFKKRQNINICFSSVVRTALVAQISYWQSFVDRTANSPQLGAKMAVFCASFATCNISESW